MVLDLLLATFLYLLDFFLLWLWKRSYSTKADVKLFRRILMTQSTLYTYCISTNNDHANYSFSKVKYAVFQPIAAQLCCWDWRAALWFIIIAEGHNFRWTSFPAVGKTEICLCTKKKFWDLLILTVYDVWFLSIEFQWGIYWFYRSSWKISIFMKSCLPADIFAWRFLAQTTYLSNAKFVNFSHRKGRNA